MIDIIITFNFVYFSFSLQPLHDIFSGIKLHIPDSLENSDSLRRYFIAYDGDHLSEFETENAAYIIVSKDDENMSTDSKKRFVDVNWLWDSIKLRSLQSVKMYFI